MPREDLIRDGIAFIEKEYGFFKGRVTPDTVLKKHTHASMLLNYLENRTSGEESEQLIKETVAALRLPEGSE